METKASFVGCGLVVWVFVRLRASESWLVAVGTWNEERESQ